MQNSLLNMVLIYTELEFASNRHLLSAPYTNPIAYAHSIDLTYENPSKNQIKFMSVLSNNKHNKKPAAAKGWAGFI